MIMRSPDSTHSGVACRALPWDGHLQDEATRLWRRLLARLTGYPPFHEPEWIALQCRHGRAPCWRVLAVTRDDEPLAIIPLRRRGWEARVIDDFHTDLPAVLIDPGQAMVAWTAIAAWLREPNGISLLGFGRLAEDFCQDVVAVPVREQGVVPLARPVMPCFTVSLPDGWEAYLNGLGTNTRRNIRRMERQLAEHPEHYFLQTVTDPSEAGKVLDQLFAIHRRRWRGQASGSIFDHLPTASAYRAALLDAMDRDRAAILVLNAGGDIAVACTTTYDAERSIFFSQYLAADARVPTPTHFSAGVYILTRVIAMAIAQGATAFHLGYGSEEYKRFIGGEAYAMAELSLAASPLAAALLPTLDAGMVHLRRTPRWLRFHWRQAIDRLHAQRGSAVKGAGAWRD